jgi:hypothetical protein
MRTPTRSSGAASVRLAALQRKPQRVTITVPGALVDKLNNRATVEGRSLSNLCAYLLESAMAGVADV